METHRPRATPPSTPASLVMERLSRLARRIERFNDWLGRTIAWFTLLMVLITFVIVVLRYVFDLGWIAMQESVTYLHTFLFMLGAAYTLRHNGHVRVDIFYQKFSERRRALIDLLGALLLLIPFCSFIFYSSWGYVAESWKLLEGSRQAGGIPAVFILKSAIPLFAVLMILQGLASAVHSLRTLRGLEPLSDEHAPQEL